MLWGRTSVVNIVNSRNQRAQIWATTLKFSLPWGPPSKHNSR
jgi:hypothetical protein